MGVMVRSEWRCSALVTRGPLRLSVRRGFLAAAARRVPAASDEPARDVYDPERRSAERKPRIPTCCEHMQATKSFPESF